MKVAIKKKRKKRGAKSGGRTLSFVPRCSVATELHNHLNITNHQLRFVIITTRQDKWFANNII